MSKSDSMMKSQCVSDMMKNVVGSMENVIRHAYNNGYKDAKTEGCSDKDEMLRMVFDSDEGCPVIETKKGHGRYGFSRVRDKWVFVISSSKNEAEVGSKPGDGDEEKPIVGLVIRDAEHAKVIAECFLEMADFLDKEQNEPESINITRDEWQTLKSSIYGIMGVIENKITKEEMKDADQNG